MHALENVYCASLEIFEPTVRLVFFRLSLTNALGSRIMRFFGLGKIRTM